MSTEPQKPSAGPPLAAAPCSAAVEQALALIDFGPCRSHPQPGEWFKVSAPMCAHCIGIENVDQAAGRIIAAEYRRIRDAQPQND